MVPEVLDGWMRPFRCHFTAAVRRHVPVLVGGSLLAPGRGFKGFASAERFCRAYDELRAFLRPRTRHNQKVPADRRRLIHLRRATGALAMLEAA